MYAYASTSGMLATKSPSKRAHAEQPCHCRPNSHARSSFHGLLIIIEWVLTLRTTMHLSFVRMTKAFDELPNNT